MLRQQKPAPWSELAAREVINYLGPSMGPTALFPRQTASTALLLTWSPRLCFHHPPEEQTAPLMTMSLPMALTYDATPARAAVLGARRIFLRSRAPTLLPSLLPSPPLLLHPPLPLPLPSPPRPPPRARRRQTRAARRSGSISTTISGRQSTARLSHRVALFDP